MLHPSFDEFVALADAHRVVPVWREALADVETPVSAYLKLVGDDIGFLLESVDHGERWSRFSFLGWQPVGTLTSRDGAISTSGAFPASVPTDQGVLTALESLLAAFSAPAIDALPPLHSGVVGFLGYDVVREVERLPDVPADDLGHPDAVLTIIGQMAAFDHWRQRVYLIDNLVIDDDATPDELRRMYDEAGERLQATLARLGAPQAYVPVPPPGDEELPETRRSMSSDDYARAVSVAKEHILAGDIFQVVLAQRFDVDLEADPFDVYRVLRQINPSPYMYFVRTESTIAVGSSPEPMVQLLGGKVISRPIAGTRRRGRDDEHDRRMAGELKENPKEIAEHVMLVDLARNDVGRVVEFGTESVDELMTLERYSHVMHMTSEVSGQLRDGLGPIDVLRATLPAGTVSGAPKVRAMQIIDELEPVKRGPYAGVVGYIDFSGNLDTAIAIRTMFIRPGADGAVASVQAGAGIVADSDPTDEDLECRNKAQALLSAIPAARRMTRQRTAAEGGQADA